MNPELPNNPREEVELKITALLLGELEAAEAERVRELVLNDPNLSRLHDELKRTLGLVREASEDLADETGPVRLSDEKRDALLAHFRTKPVPELTSTHSRTMPWYVPAAIAAVLIGLITLVGLLPTAREFAAKRPSSVTPLPGLPVSEPRETEELSSARLAARRLSDLDLNSQAASATNHMEHIAQLAGRGGYSRPRRGGEVAGKNVSTVNGPPGSIPESGLAVVTAEKTATKVALPRAESSESQDYFYLNRTGQPPESSSGQKTGNPAWLGFLNTRDTTQASDNRFVTRYASPIPEDGLNSRNKFDSNTIHSANRDQPGISGSLGASQVNQTAGSWGFGAATATRQGETPNAGRIGGGPTKKSGEQRSGERTVATSPRRGIVLPEQPASETVNLWSNPRPGDERSSRANRPETSTDIASVTKGEQAGRVRELGDLPTLGAFYRMPSQTGRELPAATGFPAKPLQRDTMTDKSDDVVNLALDSDNRSATDALASAAPAESEIKTSGMASVSGQLKQFVQAVRSSGGSAPKSTAVDEAISRQPETIVLRQKQQELEALLTKRNALERKLYQEKVDVSLTKTSSVQIVDRAEPAQPGFVGGLVGRGTQAVARIKIEPEQSDVQEPGGSSAGVSYNPYFVQTESEIIQSEPVLAKAVEKLNDKTGRRDDKLTIQELRDSLSLKPVDDARVMEIRARSEDSKEAAEMANAVAEAYRDYRVEQGRELALAGIKELDPQYDKLVKEVHLKQAEVDRLRKAAAGEANADIPPQRTLSPPAAIPQPEVQTLTNAFSTFSLNVSDVSFKLAKASLEKGRMPDVGTVRSEEFLNAFDYHDPAPAPGQPLAFAWERARDPFAHNRDLLRFSVQTAAQGREPGRPLNLVLLLDNSGSMERADRVRIIRECLNVLAGQLTAQDRISVVTFARTARLWMDGVPGVQAAASLAAVSQLTPEGGTNLEEAMKLAYATAQRHYLDNGMNRVVLLTDGAANLGDVDPDSLQQRVEAYRKQGIALDCFGIGWEGYNDDLLEVLARHGDGRYGFVNTPQEASSQFASQLAGALQVAASDVKVQVQFNPQRVTAYRQIGYAKHQLTKEQFRDNTVDAAEIGTAESGNALYVIETNPQGQGPVAIVRARFKVPATGEYKEYEWTVPYTGEAVDLENASAAMRLAATASAFSEWLVASPYAGNVTPDSLLNVLRGVPEVFGADPRPTQLESMIREAQRISGQ